MENNIQIFEGKKIRSVWDNEKEEWYFSVVDVVGILTDSLNPNNYWKVLKKRLKDEGNELVTNCNQLKMKSHKDGKMYMTDVADIQGIFRVIQSIPSPKAEPFKMWLAQVGKDRIDEISKAWSGMATREYKNLKGLKKENLRDNMSTLELVLNMLAEATTTELTNIHNPNGLEENKKVAKRGGTIAGNTRKEIEADTGKSVITAKNAVDFAKLIEDVVKDIPDIVKNSKDEEIIERKIKMSKNEIFKIGSHVGMSGKKMFLGSVEEALSYGANTFMIYTGAPQNTRRKPIEELNIDAGLKLMKENNISVEDIVVHAPYIINLGNAVKPETFEIAVQFLRTEIERTDAIGAPRIVLHPGAHVGEGAEIGIAKIVEGLNEVLTKEQKTTVALETMAGKGSECGRSFEEIAKIIDGVKLKDKLSVCFDTCHVNDAGYDIVNDFEGVIKEFDRIVGIDRISVIHLNDSKNPRGAMKDRHENLGFGTIGFEALNKIAHYEKFSHLPKILETPYVALTPEKGAKTVPPYKFEIEMLRNGKFDADVLEKIKKQ